MDTRMRSVNVIVPENEFNFFEQIVKKLGWIIEDTKTVKDDNVTELNRKQMAFERLNKMIRQIPDLDDQKELAEYRDEKYGI